MCTLVTTVVSVVCWNGKDSMDGISVWYVHTYISVVFRLYQGEGAIGISCLWDGGSQML